MGKSLVKVGMVESKVKTLLSERLLAEYLFLYKFSLSGSETTVQEKISFII